MRKAFRGISVYVLIVLLIMFGVRMLGQNIEPIKEMNVTELVKNLNDNKVQGIKMEGRTVQGVLIDETKFTTILPYEFTDSFYKDYLKDRVENEEINYSGKLDPEPSWLASMLPTLLVILVFGVFWFVFMQQSQGGGSGGKVMSFGKSKAKIHKEEDGKLVTFDEVAGLEEEKEELQEIVDFLKTPKKYIDIGARIPTGVLLVGPPGTGKTYLSRAVAGEAKVPFYTISGSDFVEMFVGVGASRVRDLFEQAKKNAPCIIFIDRKSVV